MATPKCTERVTERFSEAGGAAGKSDRLGAWSEVVDSGVILARLLG